MLLRSLALVAVVALAGVAEARDTAPLPAAFQDHTERGEFEVHDAIPALRGVYAHGVSGGAVFGEVDPAAEFCKGSQEERSLLLARYASVSTTEYWFYATSEQGVLFSKSVNAQFGVDEPPACSDLVTTSYEIQRAYVADGFTHNFVLDENTVPGIGSFRKNRNAGEYSGSFMELQSLMARAPLPAPRRGTALTRERIAGQRAICTASGGLVWSSTCYALDRPIRGMLLRSSAGDDERTGFQSQVLEIEPEALLPGCVFEVDRDWRLRGD